MRTFLVVSSLTVSVFLLFSGCRNSATNSNMSPTPTPTPTKEQQIEIAKREAAEQRQAIEEYVKKNHEGWILRGASGGSDSLGCTADIPCRLHLEKDGKDMVLAVVVRWFEKADNSGYWFVYPADAVDLSEAKIELIKSAEREKTLGNLDVDDCQAVIESLSEQNDERDGESYDPRN